MSTSTPASASAPAHPPRAHFLQHVPFEGIGNIEPWLKHAGYSIQGTHLYESTRLPAVDDFDLLVIMGGPMSVNDEAELPWLVQEKQLVRDAAAAGKPVLGICLGAQLIASAFGAPVYRNPVKEIGWFPIYGNAEQDLSVLQFPASIDVFHWHGETFDLPPGAVRLANSESCHLQAFQLGKNVIGLQCHLEVTPASLREFVINCRHELVPGNFIQTEAEILAAGPDQFQAIHELLDHVLSDLVRQ